MPRRNRGFGSGGACCHITQRCVQREFLLKFKRDRRNYVQRLGEGLARHTVSLLAYVVTSNHSHLLVWSKRASEISALMQYVGGCTAQDYNRRKERSGSYWGERYHVTLVQSGSHLSRCLFYIDMNMVRVKVVKHPIDWETGGCRELMGKHATDPLIDLEAVVRVTAAKDLASFRRWHQKTLADLCVRRDHPREPWWTEAVAVGERSYIAGLADRYTPLSRKVGGIQTDDGTEIWTMGLSKRQREGFLNSFD